MTIIANPIYDAVFKFLMKDIKVAKVLLSALLKKEIIELEVRQHEYTSVEQMRVTLLCMDFSALVREADGTEHLVVIELQKTRLITETLRFRQYLSTQYFNQENTRKEKNKSGQNSRYGLPIVSIYILGHSLGDLTEPVVYVRRSSLDYDDNVLPYPDRFIESLTHDSIIIQIPFLSGRTRNYLERILSVFDQEFRKSDSEHYLEIDEDHFEGDVQYLVHRLLQAAATPDVRRAMEIEDEIISEIENRDATIMLKSQEIEQNKLEIGKKEQMIRSMTKMLYQSGVSPNEIACQLSLPIEQIQEYIHS